MTQINTRFYEFRSLNTMARSKAVANKLQYNTVAQLTTKLLTKSTSLKVCVRIA